MATITSPRPASPTSNLRTAPNYDNSSTSSHPAHSPSITPSSSVRPSLDLPAGNGGRSSSPAPSQLQSQPQRRNNRAALRDYYNLKSKAPTAHPSASTGPSRTSSVSSITTTTTTPNDLSSQLGASLDTPDFNPQDYIQQLLQTSSLQNLLKTESSLISEIRHLDGERKALVYDNYSKLIGATEMIGSMVADNQSQYQEMIGGSRVAGSGYVGGGGGGGIGNVPLNGKGDATGGMALKDIERLRAMVEKIHGQVSQLELQETCRVDTSDSERRKNRKAERQKRELVSWVVQAPRRFESLAREGEPQQIMEDWTRIQDLLDTWDGVKGVDEVRAKCRAVVDSLEHDGRANGTGHA